MPHDAIRRIVRLALPALVGALAACGSSQRDFPGFTKDQVWKAMVETAEDPRYPDWVVVSNEVFRDDANATVEIRRDLRRDLVIVGQKPRREQCEWKFTATVESTEPPTLVFRTDTMSIPAHWWLQEQQFINEVERRLAGVALPPPRTGGSIERPPVPADAPRAAGDGTQVRPAGAEPAVPGEIPESDHAVRGRAARPAPKPVEPEPAPAAEPAPPAAEPPPFEPPPGR